MAVHIQSLAEGRYYKAYFHFCCPAHVRDREPSAVSYEIEPLRAERLRRDVRTCLGLDSE
jgi:hypothetical protein